MKGELPTSSARVAEARFFDHETRSNVDQEGEFIWLAQASVRVRSLRNVLFWDKCVRLTNEFV